MNAVGTKTGKWMTLGATVVAMLAAGVAFGEDRGSCYEAYRASGLTGQQMSFEEFRELYGDGACATGAVQATTQDGPEHEGFGRKDLP